MRTAIAAPRQSIQGSAAPSSSPPSQRRWWRCCWSPQRRMHRSWLHSSTWSQTARTCRRSVLAVAACETTRIRRVSCRIDSWCRPSTFEHRRRLRCRILDCILLLTQPLHRSMCSLLPYPFPGAIACSQNPSRIRRRCSHCQFFRLQWTGDLAGHPCLADVVKPPCTQMHALAPGTPIPQGVVRDVQGAIAGCYCRRLFQSDTGKLPRTRALRGGCAGDCSITTQGNYGGFASWGG